MKAIKLTAIMLAAAFTSITASAQEEVLTVNFKNGTTQLNRLTDIEMMTFIDPAELPAEIQTEATLEFLKINFRDGREIFCSTEDVEGMNFTFVGGESNEYTYVDLALPSGLLWSNRDLGGYIPEFRGNCYAWGEMDTKSTYDIDRSTFGKKSNAWLQEYGILDADGNLSADYDVVSYYLSEPWRIPTYEEWAELRDCCTWIPTELNRVKGSTVVGRNGMTIFLPWGGNYHGFYGEHGLYWTATPHAIDDRSWAFYFDGDAQYCSVEMRGTGIPVRPVMYLQDDTRLSTPKNVRGVAAEGAVTLNWSEVQGALNYIISRSTDRSEYVQIGTSDTNSFTDEAPNADKNYYRVQAVGGGELVSGFATTPDPVYGNPDPSAVSHEAVDLGLPSGLKWAACNLDAERPAAYSDFFSWGQTEPKAVYNNDTSSWRATELSELKERGVIDENNVLTPEYDAATVRWGGNWRTPTEAEIDELVNECEWEWTTYGGHFCMRVTGPNGNFILLPAAGYRAEQESVRTIYEGYFMSSTAVGKNNTRCIYLDQDSRENGTINRVIGVNVRPVTF